MPKMKRNANGSGTIYKRDDGRWEGKYSMPAADGSGKYVRKSIYGKTQEEVRKKLTEITAKIDELQSSALAAAKRGYVDDIIEPDATRKRVIAAFEMLSTKQEDGPARKHAAR